MTELIDKDLIFILNAEEKEDVFKEIYTTLYEKDLVTEDFLNMIIKRENEYPTGMDMSVIDGVDYNIAIPHTESYAVKTKKVIPVKLEEEILFNNMINPEESLKVKFLFIILNDGSDEQTGILAKIMDFVTQTKDINTLFEMDSKEEIYKYIQNNFDKEII